MNLRPDEAAAEEDIERSQSTNKLLKKGANLAIGAGTAALGIGAASKILPFLNEYVPVDLAIKGISKFNPELGKKLRKGQSLGLNLKEGFNFIRDQLTPKEEEPQEHPLVKQAKDFETNYPDIASAISNLLNQGQSPEAAAAILKKSTPFGSKIKKLEKELGKDFIDFVVELFGAQGQTMQQTQQPQQPQQMQPQQPQQQGIDPQLMQIMQGIRTGIQNLRGGGG
jgi:hypothetical protein